MQIALHAGWPFVGALLYSALIVSLFAHTSYVMLLQKYEANLISALSLMTPLITIGMGVVLFLITLLVNVGSRSIIRVIDRRLKGAA